MRFSAFRKSKERFVAGETIDELVNVVKTLNSLGLKTSVDFLGENVISSEQATNNKKMYFGLFDKIHKESLDSHVSIKLTALGLDVNENLCKQNVEEIVAAASDIGSFVRIDMENSPYTEHTLKIYKDSRKTHNNLGIVIQSALYRSLNDIDCLIKENIANVRLCKGAYLESPDIAFPKKSDVDGRYVGLSAKLLSSYAYPAFATHDETIIGFIKNYANELGIEKNRFEFQMLYGIRSELQKELVKEGYKVRVYVPFGHDWYGYFCRRLAERPANVLFVLKNFWK